MDHIPLKMVRANEVECQEMTKMDSLEGDEMSVWEDKVEKYDMDNSWEFEIFNKIMGMVVKGCELEVIELMKKMKGRGVGGVVRFEP